MTASRSGFWIEDNKMAKRKHDIDVQSFDTEISGYELWCRGCGRTFWEMYMMQFSHFEDSEGNEVRNPSYLTCKVVEDSKEK